MSKSSGTGFNVSSRGSMGSYMNNSMPTHSSSGATSQQLWQEYSGLPFRPHRGQEYNSASQQSGHAWPQPSFLNQNDYSMPSAGYANLEPTYFNSSGGTNFFSTQYSGASQNLANRWNQGNIRPYDNEPNRADSSSSRPQSDSLSRLRQLSAIASHRRPSPLPPISEYSGYGAYTSVPQKYYDPSLGSQGAQTSSPPVQFHGFSNASQNTLNTRFGESGGEQVLWGAQQESESGSQSSRAKRPRTDLPVQFSTRPSTDINFKFTQKGGNCTGYSYEWMSDRIKNPDSSLESRRNFIHDKETRSNSVATQEIYFHSYDDKEKQYPDSPTHNHAHSAAINSTNERHNLSTASFGQGFYGKPISEILNSTANSLKSSGLYLIQVGYLHNNGNYKSHAMAADSTDSNQWKLFDPNRGEFNVSMSNIGATISNGVPENSIDEIILTKVNAKPRRPQAIRR